MGLSYSMLDVRWGGGCMRVISFKKMRVIEGSMYRVSAEVDAAGANCIVFDFEKLGLTRNLLSMFMDVTSLTMIPIFRLLLLVRRYWRVVVLPEPRNPARRVMGTPEFSSSLLLDVSVLVPI